MLHLDEDDFVSDRAWKGFQMVVKLTDETKIKFLRQRQISMFKTSFAREESVNWKRKREVLT